MYIIKYFKNNLNIGYKSIIIILKKAPTPKVDAPKMIRYMSLRTPLTLWIRQGEHFIYAYFSYRERR